MDARTEPAPCATSALAGLVGRRDGLGQAQRLVTVGEEQVLRARPGPRDQEGVGALLDGAVGDRDPLLVLAQVLLPGGGQVGLVDALGIAGVLVERPALAAGAPVVA